MANGDFQSGTWTQLPTNCTQSFSLTYTRCAEYGYLAISECTSWATNVLNECVSGVWNTVKSCSWWSWLFCVLYAIVSTFVCTVFAVVVIVICLAITIVELIICILWSVVSIFFCLSKANGGTSFLLTDGTIMMQESKSADIYWLGVPQATWGTNRWWKLTPDAFGSYQNGSWSRLADSQISRTYYASAVLADGRVVVCGGEYSDTSGTLKQDDANTCEVYDPVANTWAPFATPVQAGSKAAAWSKIGDAPCTLLPNGALLMGSIATADVAKLDPVSLTWTPMSRRQAVGTSDEDSWVLMPDNTIAAPSCTDPPTTWVYDITTDLWHPRNDLPVSVVDAQNEIGPALLRYDGTAFFLGSNQHTAIYNAAANPKWSNGPDLPDQNGLKIGIVDGPAALLVNGNILFAAGATDDAGDWSSPCWFFEFDGSSFNRTNDPPNYVSNTYATRLLLLPTGDVMFCREDDSDFYAYHSEAAVPQDNFRPVIQVCPSNFAPGAIIQVSGLQFNGLSQAVAYGDDSQTATNYPLVRILNKQTNHLRYCRTSNHTTVDQNGNPIPSMGVATGVAVITTTVDIPPDIDSGDSSLVVVANGIPSQPFDVSIEPILL